MSALSDLMGVLLPGGIAAGVALVAQGVQTWRKGRNSTEETAIQRWQRIGKAAVDRASVAEQNEDYAEEVARHWQRRAGDLEHLLRSNGIAVPDPKPLPVRGKVRVSSGTARRRRTTQRTREPEDFDEDLGT